MTGRHTGEASHLSPLVCLENKARRSGSAGTCFDIVTITR